MRYSGSYPEVVYVDRVRKLAKPYEGKAVKRKNLRVGNPTAKPQSGAFLKGVCAMAV